MVVGRGPVPRDCSHAGDRPPHYDEAAFFSFVGRGPVPRDRQEMRGTGPRTTMAAAFFSVS